MPSRIPGTSERRRRPEQPDLGAAPPARTRPPGTESSSPCGSPSRTEVPSDRYGSRSACRLYRTCTSTRSRSKNRHQVGMHRDRGRTGRLRDDEEHLELPVQLGSREAPPGARVVEGAGHAQGERQRGRLDRVPRRRQPHHPRPHPCAEGQHRGRDGVAVASPEAWAGTESVTPVTDGPPAAHERARSRITGTCR